MWPLPKINSSRTTVRRIFLSIPQIHNPHTLRGLQRLPGRAHPRKRRRARRNPRLQELLRRMPKENMRRMQCGNLRTQSPIGRRFTKRLPDRLFSRRAFSMQEWMRADGGDAPEIRKRDTAVHRVCREGPLELPDVRQKW